MGEQGFKRLQSRLAKAASMALNDHELLQCAIPTILYLSGPGLIGGMGQRVTQRVAVIATNDRYLVAYWYKLPFGMRVSKKGTTYPRSTLISPGPADRATESWLMTSAFGEPLYFRDVFHDDAVELDRKVAPQP